jgi:Fur family zinc uptake transcriptional regulator
MNAVCEHDHGQAQGLSGAGLSRELALARENCAARGERMTSSRERVLELLLRAGAPVKAYDLMADFSSSGQSAKPPTVYRALEFLERQGLAHRVESLNAFVACRHVHGRQAAFLICDCCGTTCEFDPGEAAPLERQAATAGFTVSSLVLEAHGLCAACQQAPSQ